MKFFVDYSKQDGRGEFHRRGRTAFDADDFRAAIAQCAAWWIGDESLVEGLLTVDSGTVQNGDQKKKARFRWNNAWGRLGGTIASPALPALFINDNHLFDIALEWDALNKIHKLKEPS